MNTLRTDVPRIAGIPAWNAIDVFDGSRWLSDSSQGDQLREYRQVIDMRTGAARTSYSWSSGTRQTKVESETFVSRADQHLAGTKLVLTPREAGRLRVRFALAGWPPPKRLALAQLTRAEPDWRPAVHVVPGSDSRPVPCGGARSCRCAGSP